MFIDPHRMTILFSTCAAVLSGFFATPSQATNYDNGYVWERSTNWTVNGTSPDPSSKQDDQGTVVWNYTYVSGGSLINDTGTNKWWSLARTNMTAGEWYGAPVFLSGSSLPYFSQGAAQMHTNAIDTAPLAVWTCPVDNAEIEIGGRVSWRGGGGTNTASADYVLALRRAADSSWQVLDSAVFVPNGGTSPGYTREYSGAQALAPLSLSQGDQLVWGFKRHSNFTSNGGWINMNDSLTFTLGYSTSIADVEVYAPLSGSSKAIFTLDLNRPDAGIITVDYATADGTALAGTDYAATSGTLEFTPGETTKTISVPIMAVTEAQNAKSFSLTLSNPVGVDLGRATATCTILSNVVAPVTGLTAIPMGTSGIDLAWIEPAALPGGYQVERSIAGGGWTILATLPTGTNTYRDINIVPDASYSYRITSFNDAASNSSSVAQATMPSKANTLPPSAFGMVRDYGSTWWAGGSRGSAVWHVKTSRYAMTFNSGSLSLTSIFPLEETLPETTALDQPQSESFPASAPSSSLSATMTSSGSSVVIQPAATNTNNTHLLNNGKFYQRRWVKIKTNSGPALNTAQSGYEVIAWPDRVSIICRVVPTSSVTGGSLTMTLNLDSIFDELSGSGVAQALAATDDSGYVVFKSAGSDTITVDPTNSRVTIETDAGTWNADEERTVGLVIYPSNDVAQTLPVADQIESGSLTVTAVQTAPVNVTITPSYELDYGYYEILMPTNTRADDSNRIERNQVTIQNPTSSPQLARLAFNKGAFGKQAGISCFLRDMDGNPLGIPVQLSKNWHNATSDRWIGSWFNGMTLLTIPPNTTLQFEAVVLGQNYAGIPAASHAQLSLVGWGGNGNHQWDESAIGCWGETLVYDPDSALAGAIGTDSRPMLLLRNTGDEKQWTGNYGGCDFLRYYDGGGTRRYQKRIRSWYQRYGPNLTDVTYAGETDNSLIDFKYSTSIYRSNDYVRGRHHIRYDVKSDASFNRMVFFQMASDNYNYNAGTAHAYGYAGDLSPTQTWTTAGPSTPVELTGALPWFSTLNCPVDSRVPSQTGAQRGFIIRSWNARINGQDNVSPYFVANGSRVDLVPPPGVTALKAGDYIEAEIERVYFGQAASAYYGEDDHFRTALQDYGNQHEMVMREAVGNDLSVNVSIGTLEKSYPVQIRTSDNTAEFSITGGIGYMPITLTGLTDYRSPLLEENSGGAWVALGATTGGGNAWQADYEPESGTWQLTINVRLDDAAYQDITALRDSAATRTFRFRQAGAPSATVAPSGPAVPGVPMPQEINLSSPDTDVSSISVYAISSDNTLISNQNLSVTGSGANRTFTFTPNPGMQGSASITLYIVDVDGRVTVWTLPVNVNARLAWEAAYLEGITDPNLIDDGEDPDGDGMINLWEYQAGTNPLDPSDFLSISNFEPFVSPSKHSFHISGRAGRAYCLERAPDLKTWGDITESETLPSDQTITLEDLNPPASDSLFYRVRPIAP